MIGKILGIDVDGNSGVITGEDGNRYPFNLKEIKNARKVKKSEEVDFLVEENQAVEIYITNQNLTINLDPLKSAVSDGVKKVQAMDTSKVSTTFDNAKNKIRSIDTSSVNINGTTSNSVVAYMFMPLKKYATFTGRATRPEFWYFILFVIIGQFLTLGIDLMTGSLSSESGVGVVGTLFSLGVLIPSIAVSVRRLHDINYSGWWLLITLIPIIGGLIFLFFALQKSNECTNRFDERSAEVFQETNTSEVTRDSELKEQEVSFEQTDSEDSIMKEEITSGSNEIINKLSPYYSKIALFVGLVIFVVFTRFTILDSGFLFGIKAKASLESPIAVVEYRTKEGSFLGSLERGFGYVGILFYYDFIIIGVIEGEVLFLERVPG